MDASIFCGISTAEEIKASRQHFTCKTDCFGKMPLLEHCKGKQSERVKAIYNKSRTRIGMSGVVIGDASQNAVSTYGMVSPFLPRPVTNSHPVAFNIANNDSTGHVLTLQESYFAMGYPFVHCPGNEEWRHLADVLPSSITSVGVPATLMLHAA